MNKPYLPFLNKPQPKLSEATLVALIFITIIYAAVKSVKTVFKLIHS